GGALALVEAQPVPGANNAPATRATGVGKAARQPGASMPKSAAGSTRGMGAMMGPMAGMSGMSSGGADDDPEMNELAQTEAAIANESAEIPARSAQDGNPAA